MYHQHNIPPQGAGDHPSVHSQILTSVTKCRFCIAYFDLKRLIFLKTNFCVNSYNYNVFIHFIDTPLLTLAYHCMQTLINLNVSICKLVFQQTTILISEGFISSFILKLPLKLNGSMNLQQQFSHVLKNSAQNNLSE